MKGFQVEFGVAPSTLSELRVFLNATELQQMHLQQYRNKVGVVSQDWNFSQVEVEMVESWWNSDMNMIENGKKQHFFLGALKGSTSRGTNNFVPEEDWLISIS